MARTVADFGLARASKAAMRAAVDHLFYRLVPGRGRLDEELQIFRLPAHGRIDSITPARMIVEHKLFDRPGTHFAVLAKVNCRLRKTVRLPARIQAIHVRFVLARSCLRVFDWR